MKTDQDQKRWERTENRIRELLPRLVDIVQPTSTQYGRVINRPIRLEDALEAVLISRESVVSVRRSELLRMLCDMWRYGKPYSEQDQETKAFISDLMNTK